MEAGEIAFFFEPSSTLCVSTHYHSQPMTSEAKALLQFRLDLSKYSVCLEAGTDSFGLEEDFAN
jgi:hypothetical protein